jgi:DDE superfamily endonuclease
MFLEGVCIPAGFWIAGDAAYNCTDYMLTKVYRTMLLASGFLTSRDAFNIYQNSHRVHIEQAFGMLVNRFAIFWQPFMFDLLRCRVIVGVAMRLKNWYVELNSKMPESEREQRQFDGQCAHWWDEAAGVRECVSSRQGMISDLMQNSTFRDSLTEILEDIGA